ncbi:MAG: hypothetical protein OXU23_02455 [Candidatus Poribacteria bacterium]|nr:hypothetical protein [Candidatus Poribacteria bacterium]
MKFEILNVEHGFCAYAIAEDNSVLLFDCGYSQTCYPSKYLWEQGIRVIRRFFITNYDEDHIANLPEVRQFFKIETITRNCSVNSDELLTLKTHPISDAMQELLKMIDNFTGEVAIGQFQSEGIQVQIFYNLYPTFTDTNNLSLLTFLDIGEVCFALTGDLERSGWIELLKKPVICELLKRVNVFVASHHGRESGYCREVFDYCCPRFIIMSDGPVEYDTQKMAGVYGQHAIGGLFNGQKRKVLTTRKDGGLVWNL